MANPELIRFIAEETAAGHTEADIRAGLKGKGWADSDIDMAYAVSGVGVGPGAKLGNIIAPAWQAMKLVWRRLLKLYGWFLLRFIVAAVPAVIIFVVLRVLENMGSVDKMVSGLVSVVLLVVLVIVFCYLSIWMQVASLLVVKNRGIEYATQQATAEARGLIGGYFWTSLLTGILVMLWSFLFVIPAIIFGLYYCFGTQIVADKRISGMAAIRQSKAYVKGRWWQVFWAIMAMFAVAFLIFLGVTAITEIIGEVAGAAVNVIVNIIFSLYTVTYTWLMYERLKQLHPEIQ